MVLNYPKWSEMVLFGPKWSQMVLNGPKWSHMDPHGPKWSQMVPNGPIWSQMVPYDPKCPRWSQEVPNCPKWSQMVPKSPKRSQMLPNWSKCFQIVLNGPKWASWYALRPSFSMYQSEWAMMSSILTFCEISHFLCELCIKCFRELCKSDIHNLSWPKQFCFQKNWSNYEYRSVFESSKFKSLFQGLNMFFLL